MQEYGEYRSMVSAHRCYLRSRGYVSGHHHGNKGGFHAGFDPHLSQSGWMGVNGAVCFGLSPIPRGGPKSVCDATFLDRQCRRCATDGGDLYPDGGYALASIYRHLGFFHHDSRHADFHRDRVFESLGSRRRVEAEFSSPFPASNAAPLPVLRLCSIILATVLRFYRVRERVSAGGIWIRTIGSAFCLS